MNKNHKVYFHAIGTTQDDDDLVYERPDHPDWNFGAEVTEDGRFLLVYQNEGTDPKNRVFLRDLRDPKGVMGPFLDAFDADYQVVGNDGDVFYVRTDNGAPRYRLLAIDRRNPAPRSWREILPEHPAKGVLSSVTMVGDRFVAVWETDAHDRLEVRGKDGALQREVALPGIGSVSVSGRRRYAEFVYLFTSFTYPTTGYRCDPATGASTLFRQPKVAFDPAAYETVQVFYPSKDGTKIPMFVTAKKGVARDGRNPTYLTGYGGFNSSSTPFFSPATILWLEMGGVHALANLRGGGEYGKEWHDAGRLKNKQNVFDDFIAAAEYLVREKYTSPAKLAIAGGSNGGPLVGAVLNQRPDLFGAALPAVEMPLMTDTGTFVINGTERVVVSQLHRSPGVFFSHDKGKTHVSGRLLYSARVIPSRGSWLDFEFDTKDILYVRIDRRRKLPATIVLKALGYSNEDLLKIFYPIEPITISGNKFTREVSEVLIGLKSSVNIYSPGKELILKEGSKITRGAIRKMEASGIKTIPISKEEIIGRITLKDIIDPATGEVILEGNEVIWRMLLTFGLQASKFVIF